MPQHDDNRTPVVDYLNTLAIFLAMMVAIYILLDLYVLAPR